MADFGQLDEDLDALADGLDLDAVLLGVQSGVALSDVDELLGALAEGVAIPETAGDYADAASDYADAAGDDAEGDGSEGHRASRSFAPPKMSEEEQREAEAEHAASGAVDPSWGNLSAALTPSDLAELAALEAGVPYVSQRPEAAASAPPESVRPKSVLPGSIPPASVPPGSIPAPIPAAPIPSEVSSSASVAPGPRAASIPPPTPGSDLHPFAAPSASRRSEPPPESTTVFSQEDIAAIRASTPPPAGDFGSVEVEIGEIEEIALDDLELLDFDDFEDLSEPDESESSQEASDAADGGGEDGEDGEDGEKKGFFKKIFG